jgi:hypothetical protein
MHGACFQFALICLAVTSDHPELGIQFSDRPDLWLDFMHHAETLPVSGCIRFVLHEYLIGSITQDLFQEEEVHEAP